MTAPGAELAARGAPAWIAPRCAIDLFSDARDHLAFGQGVRRCAGGHLAQLELESLLRGWRSFPAAFHRRHE